jgi:hypothetical protein
VASEEDDRKLRMRKWLSLEVISQQAPGKSCYAEPSPASNNSLDVDFMMNGPLNTNDFKSSSFNDPVSCKKTTPTPTTAIPAKSRQASRLNKSIDDVKVNMMNVLNDIKNLDHMRVLADNDYRTLVAPRRISVPVMKVDTPPNSKLNLSSAAVDELEDKMVKKLKEKFENKDQTFVKVKN